MAALFQKTLKASGMACACIALFLIFGLSKAMAGFEPPSVTLSFSDLSGTNLQPYLGSMEVTAEGTFTVTPASGSWYQATYYGDPQPSILDGPVNQPGDGEIELTDSEGLFTLSGFAFSSNNGDSAYVIQGYLGGTLQYQESGDLPGTFGPFSLSTLDTANPTVAVDGLFIGILPGDGVTSVNLDNIVVATVPEPSDVLLWGLGLAGFICFRMAGRKN